MRHHAADSKPVQCAFESHRGHSPDQAFRRSSLFLPRGLHSGETPIPRSALFPLVSYGESARAGRSYGVLALRERTLHFNRPLGGMRVRMGCRRQNGAAREHDLFLWLVSVGMRVMSQSRMSRVVPATMPLMMV